MLPRGNRLTRSADFDSVVRGGVRAGSTTVVVHLRRQLRPLGPAAPLPRVGLVVSRAVGSAVVRNKVKRRLRHLLRERLSRIGGCDVVVRANPAAAGADVRMLGADVDRCLRRVLVQPVPSRRTAATSA